MAAGLSTSDPSGLQVHRLLDWSVAEGPGVRSVVWVQGCSIRCPGCFNPGTWAAAGGRWVSVDAVVSALTAREDIEGVTFLGGEPFDQAGALAAVATQIRRRGLSVMTFSGYRYETLLRSRRREWADLLEHTDLLVDGPFDGTRLDQGRPWVGSTNQCFHFLTDRYLHLAGKLEDISDRIELRVRRDGTVEVNGLASADQLDALLTGLGRRRPHMPARGSATDS